jgi:hypothetical protein
MILGDDEEEEDNFEKVCFCIDIDIVVSEKFWSSF